jgi:acid phosphatase family membrane protein YuiD
MMVLMARSYGMSSPYFALALLFGLIVMYDAAGVRRAAGLHAKVINVLRYSISPTEKLSETSLTTGDPRHHGGKEDKPLKEFVGHTPLEVLCGAAVGVAIGFMFSVG